jgi:hypothetical protein
MQDTIRLRTLILGAVVGALTGLGAAYLLVQRAERSQSETTLSTGEGLRLGLLVLGLLRSIAQLGEEN